MKNQNIKKIVITALFAALTCVATMVIQVPSPMNGYVNLGDCFVLLAAWTLGPVYGGLAAGIGSMLADVLTSYTHYAPGTLVIKGLIAVAASLVFSALKGNVGKKFDAAARVISGIVGEVIMVVGYFGYASLFLGKGLAAASSIPGNIVQAVFGIITATVLIEVIVKNKALRSMLLTSTEKRHAN